MPGRFTSAQFVGREVAFARLASVLDDVTTGHARSAILGGSAGVGVTRFLDEATIRVADLAAPWTILRGAAWPSGSEAPYGPLIRAIGPRLRALPDVELCEILGPASSDLARLLPDLAPRIETLLPGHGESTAPERR